MDDKQWEMYQYLYDLQGYLVIEDVLSRDQVDELNGLIDAHVPPVADDWEATIASGYRFGAAGGSHPTSPGFLEWGQPFIDLMDHPVLMQVMRMQLGDCFRLDRLFGVRMGKGMPSGRLHADYGASTPHIRVEAGKYFPQPAHEALHGFGVAVFSLADSGPETGGLRVIPGSHNSHFRLPEAIQKGEIDGIAVCPHAPAGSLVVFSEATTHGTQAWVAEHERRSLLYKYCASQLTWSRARVTPPPGLPLTDRQTALLAEPGGGHWYFESLFDDGGQVAD